MNKESIYININIKPCLFCRRGSTILGFFIEGDHNDTTTLAQEIEDLINQAIADNIPQLADLIAELGDPVPGSAEADELDEGTNATGNCGFNKSVSCHLLLSVYRVSRVVEKSWKFGKWQKHFPDLEKSWNLKIRPKSWNFETNHEKKHGIS